MATSDDEEMESFMIEDELCRQIADTPQNEGIKKSKGQQKRRANKTGRVIAVKHSFTC